jgi:phospholipid/cholesterol/gamma-HCH transport system substrate-binding protein
VARFSETLDKRDAQLRTLLENANKATTVLGERSNEVVGLVTNTNTLLIQLQTQSSALDHIATNISALAQQVKGFIADNREALRPALENLNKVLAIVDNRKERVQKAIKGLNGYALSLGESVSSGPYFKAYLTNLLPGQFLQPFIDVAFSDLGLDPNVLLPSQLTDPQTGQPATPPLPMPFPRTGQNGDPRLTLPDAITGNPNDHQCGPPGVPLPGPGCYPYREPGPAPAPGGPPPGPPALTPPGPRASVLTPPGPLEQQAPGETPSSGGGGQ